MVQYLQWVNVFRIIVVRDKIVSWDSFLRGHTMSMIIIMEPEWLIVKVFEGF